MLGAGHDDERPTTGLALADFSLPACAADVALAGVLGGMFWAGLVALLAANGVDRLELKFSTAALGAYYGKILCRVDGSSTDRAIPIYSW